MGLELLVMLIKKEIKSKSQLLIIGSLLFLTGLTILSYKVITYYKKYNKI